MTIGKLLSKISYRNRRQSLKVRLSLLEFIYSFSFISLAVHGLSTFFSSNEHFISCATSGFSLSTHWERLLTRSLVNETRRQADDDDAQPQSCLVYSEWLSRACRAYVYYNIASPWHLAPVAISRFASIGQNCKWTSFSSFLKQRFCF